MQWKWPNVFGGSKFLVVFGGLHIEMALWNTIGDFLEGSGWTAALTEAGVATAGKAESCLKASHLTRPRCVHQVTLLALANLQREACNQMKLHLIYVTRFGKMGHTLIIFSLIYF